MKAFLERHRICPLGLLLIAVGIGISIVVLAEEFDGHYLSPPKTGSGLISAFSILSGTLFQIARQFRK